MATAMSFGLWNCCHSRAATKVRMRSVSSAMESDMPEFNTAHPPNKTAISIPTHVAANGHRVHDTDMTSTPHAWDDPLKCHVGDWIPATAPTVRSWDKKKGR